MKCTECDPTITIFFVTKVGEFIPKIKCSNCLKDYIIKNGLEKIQYIKRVPGQK